MPQLGIYYHTVHLLCPNWESITTQCICHVPIGNLLPQCICHAPIWNLLPDRVSVMSQLGIYCHTVHMSIGNLLPHSVSVMSQFEIYCYTVCMSNPYWESIATQCICHGHIGNLLPHSIYVMPLLETYCHIVMPQLGIYCNTVNMSCSYWESIATMCICKMNILLYYRGNYVSSQPYFKVKPTLTWLVLVGKHMVIMVASSSDNNFARHPITFYIIELDVRSR